MESISESGLKSIKEISMLHINIYKPSLEDRTLILTVEVKPWSFLLVSVCQVDGYKSDSSW